MEINHIDWNRCYSDLEKKFNSIEGEFKEKVGSIFDKSLITSLPADYGKIYIEARLENYPPRIILYINAGNNFRNIGREIEIKRELLAKAISELATKYELHASIGSYPTLSQTQRRELKLKRLWSYGPDSPSFTLKPSYELYRLHD